MGRQGIHPLRLAAVVAFLVVSVAIAFGTADDTHWTALLLVAVFTGGYLALNIGANDAANNISTAVGSGALSLSAAILVACVGELSGAFLASDPVSARLREGLFQADAFAQDMELASVLVSGMLAAALWLHIATFVRTPVSATHSVIGGLLGAGIFANGWSIVQWDQIASIATVWLLTPLAAGLTAAGVLYGIDLSIAHKPNPVGAARVRVPLLIALLSLLLADYFFVELTPADGPAGSNHLLASLAVAVLAFLIAQPLVNRTAQTTKNSRKGVNQLFTAPLVVAAAFFAFAHGANDVSNIAAPLTVVANIAADNGNPTHVVLPTWALGIGAFGIVVGLVAYGSRLVRTVGSEITDIDKLRAFCIAFSAALVVSAASHFGFPVSTTHTLVGSIFGVGLLRELRTKNERRTLAKVRKCYAGANKEALNSFLSRFQGATPPRRREMLDSLYREHGDVQLSREDLKHLDTLSYKQVIKHSLVQRIVVLWMLTIPATGLIGGLLYQLAGTIN
jgi:PiT family inorganic phosphate transporter